MGVDGSEPSVRALRFAADLADELDDADLVVVFARHIYLAMPDHSGEGMYSDVLNRTEQSIRDEAERVLAHRDLRWKVVSREGEPSSVLCDVAHELGASFVVAGRRGSSMISELLLGSVSNRLVHRSDCPVLLVTD